VKTEAIYATLAGKFPDEGFR